LANNTFHGSFDFVTNCVKLQRFDGSGNLWNSSLPAVVPSQLDTISCVNCELWGAIPASWAASSLKKIYLSNNQLESPLPAFRRVAILDLSWNALTGSFDTVLEPMWRVLRDEEQQPEVISMQRLDLSFNRLHGDLHQLLFSCTLVSTTLFLNLGALSLAGNPLTGQLPLVLCNDRLPVLTTLDLSSTSIGSEVPNVFARMPDLQV